MFKQLTIRTRLLAAFGGVALAGAISGGAAVAALSRVNDNAHSLYATNVQGLTMVKDFTREIVEVARFRGFYAAAGDETARERFRKTFEEHISKASGLLDQATPFLTTPAETAALGRARVELNGYLPVARGYIEAVGRTAPPVVPAEIVAANEAAIKGNGTVTESAAALSKATEAAARDASADSERIFSSARWLVATLCSAGVFLAVILGLRISTRLARDLGGEPEQAADVARRVAHGELDMNIPVKVGDTGSLMAAMHEMQVRLRGIVGGIRSSSDSIATASAQIAQGNQDLSSRTEQQAAALQQTAASMAQLTTTVAQNADSAATATGLASGARQIAVSGKTSVDQVVEKMRDIDSSGRRVAEIVGVIDGIAFQTNILALNAAVEAARAGESGRGFAVVASEVRTLAQRSADAAREIKQLISCNVESVEAGSRLADEAGRNMEQIVSSIQRVNDIVGEIAAASTEQRSGIEQVDGAVHQLDNATQQNAALVEESAAAAHSLREQAQVTKKAMDFFKTVK